MEVKTQPGNLRSVLNQKNGQRICQWKELPGSHLEQIRICNIYNYGIKSSLPGNLKIIFKRPPLSLKLCWDAHRLAFQGIHWWRHRERERERAQSASFTHAKYVDREAQKPEEKLRRTSFFRAESAFWIHCFFYADGFSARRCSLALDPQNAWPHWVASNVSAVWIALHQDHQHQHHQNPDGVLVSPPEPLCAPSG